MSPVSGLIRFADWDVRTGSGKPFFVILIGIVPIAIWAIFSEQPPADGPVWGIIGVCVFFAACASLGIWRAVRFVFERHKRLKAMEELEIGGERRG